MYVMENSVENDKVNEVIMECYDDFIKTYQDMITFEEFKELMLLDQWRLEEDL